MGQGAAMSGDLQRIGEALAFIDPTDRETWLKTAMAVKSEVGEAGFDVWDGWSQGAESYRAADARDVWRSCKPNGGIGAGTLFHLAKSHGWQDAGDRPRTTQEELAERRRESQERAAREQAKTERRRSEAATKAAAIWEAAADPTGNPYLVRKGVVPVETLREIDADAAAKILGYVPKSGGAPLTGRLLVVPVKVGEGLSTLELIDREGCKTALAGGAKKAGYWASEPLPEGDGAGATLLIGEGVATVLSAREATGHPAVAALSSGNLGTVAQTLRDRYPAARLVVLSDLVKATGEPDPHAPETARAVGGLVAVPDFGPDREPGQTDFNDLAQAMGPEAVARAIGAAGAPAEVAGVASDISGFQAGKGLHLVTRETLGEDLAIETPSPGADPNGGEQPTASLFPPANERPRYVVLDDWHERKGRRVRPGVYWCAANEEKGELILSETWICSPVHVEAVTFDGQSNNFGRLLRFKNTLGAWREWAMPMELLRGSGEELRGELLSMGVELDPYGKERQLLSAYLQHEHPKRRIHCALQTGWAGTSFVLPDAVIGPDAAGVIFQSGERGHDEHTRAGTLDGWRSEIAARAVGNPLLRVALSAGFAGPMLGRCNAEGGGLHFVSDSSTGKTTLIEAACSIWGGPNYRRSWRATANGMEGAAALFNDCLLALDEISECDPREIGSIVYALGNGRGKQRASRSGAARGVVRWRCFILSSGERTLATAMHEGGRRAKAGQSVRLLDIPAARAFGAWDNLHGLASGAAFADALKRAAIAHHGHPGRAFLERLTQDRRDFCAYLEEFKAQPIFAVGDGEGQDKRAAARLALVGMAGELATEYGLTGWPEGEAIQAAALAFDLWRSLRGKGNDERRQILERVSGFIERHGDGRFSNADATDEGPMVRDRAGWWRETATGRDYLFTAEGMREALTGFDFRRALDVLQEAEALEAPAADGKRARFFRIGGRGVKLYPIQADRLDGGEHGA
jgi:putative DNA primase/helicase